MQPTQLQNPIYTTLQPSGSASKKRKLSDGGSSIQVKQEPGMTGVIRPLVEFVAF